MSSPFTFSFGGGGAPSPFKFSTPSMTPPMPGGGDAQLQAFQVAAMNNPDLAGILGTIKNAGGDVVGAITSVLPKNADGSVNWGAIGSDLVGFIKNHGKDILSGLTAYENYSRQNKADSLGQDALKTATDQYAQKQPLRDAGMAGMLNPSATTPDLTRLGTMATAGQVLQAPQPIPFAGAGNMSNLQTVAGSGSGNPFAKALPLAPRPVTAPPPITPATPTPYIPTKPGGAIPLASGGGTPAPPPTGPVGGPPTPPAKLPPGARNAPALPGAIPLAPQAPTPPTIGGIKPLMLAPIQ